MATSYSRGYKLKLIGTGLEAGTWGSSTNENLKRIDQYLGGVSTNLIIDSPESPSSYNASADTLDWILLDTTDAWEAGATARSRYVKFTGTVTADQTVNIYGSSSSESTEERVYWVTNGLTGDHKITFSAAGATNFDLLNGSTALIYSDSSGNVEAITETLQLAGVDFADTAAANIHLKATESSALAITDGTTEFIKFDTRADSVVTTTADTSKFVSTTFDLDAGVVDTKTQVTQWNFKDAEDAGLKFTSGVSYDEDWLTLDSGGTDEVIFGKNVTFNSSTGVIDLIEDQDILIKAASATALEIKEKSGDAFLTVDTDADSVTTNKSFITDAGLAVNSTTPIIDLTISDTKMARVYYDSETTALETSVTGGDSTGNTIQSDDSDEVGGVRVVTKAEAGTYATNKKNLLFQYSDDDSGSISTMNLTPGYDKTNHIHAGSVGSIKNVSADSEAGGTYKEWSVLLSGMGSGLNRGAVFYTSTPATTGYSSVPAYWDWYLRCISDDTVVAWEEGDTTDLQWTMDQDQTSPALFWKYDSGVTWQLIENYSNIQWFVIYRTDATGGTAGDPGQITATSKWELVVQAWW